MEQASLKEEVHRAAGLAGEKIAASRDDLMSFAGSISTAAERLEGSAEETRQAEVRIRAILDPEEDWAADLMGAISRLGDASKAMQNRARLLRKTPLLQLLNGGSVTGPIDKALELARQMATLEPDRRRCADKATEIMGFLREALAAVQSVETDSAEVESGTRRLAKALALLYPISQIHDKPSTLPEEPAKKASLPAGAERRAAPRLAIEAEVGFQSETNFFTGFTEDISTGGLFVATYDTLPMGSKLSVNFTLPDGRLISVEGVVRWIREFNEMTPDTVPGMGVQFESLSAEDEETIRSFIEERSPLFFEE